MVTSPAPTRHVKLLVKREAPVMTSPPVIKTCPRENLWVLILGIGNLPDHNCGAFMNKLWNI